MAGNSWDSQNLPKKAHVWIGLTIPSDVSTWDFPVWDDSSIVDYTNWYTEWNEPDNPTWQKCAILFADRSQESYTRKWLSAECGEIKGFICEQSASPAPAAGSCQQFWTQYNGNKYKVIVFFKKF